MTAIPADECERCKHKRHTFQCDVRYVDTGFTCGCTEISGYTSNPAIIVADFLGIPPDERAVAYCDAEPTKAELRKAGVYSTTARGVRREP